MHSDTREAAAAGAAGAAREAARARVPRPRAGPPAPAPLRPTGVHDLRGRTAPSALLYPDGDLVVVSGVPGSGKSTLIRRTTRAPVIDSEDVRARIAARLPDGLPYRVYRTPVRILHYARLARAALAGPSPVVHDCGAVGTVRRALARRRRVHLVVLDATPGEARDGQLRRGRRVADRTFDRHREATARLLAALTTAAASGSPLPDGCTTAVLLDRPAARTLRRIAFTAD